MPDDAGLKGAGDSLAPGTAWDLRARGGLLLAAVCASALAYSFHFATFAEVKTAALALCAAGMGIVAIAAGRMPAGGFRAYLPLWILLLYALGVGLIRPAPYLPDFVTSWLQALLVLLAACLAFDFLAAPVARARVLGAVMWTAAAAGVLGVGQYAGLLPGLFPVFAGYTQPIYSVFGNQDFLGGYLAAGLAIAACRLFGAERSPVPAALAAFPIVLALGLSGSRSAWLAGAAGLAVAYWLRHPGLARLAAAGGGGLVATGIVMLTAPGQSVHRLLNTFTAEDVGGPLRLWFWDGAWRMFTSSPYFGKGLGSFGFYSPRYQGAALRAPGGEEHAWNPLHTRHAHSEPLELLAELGIPGAVLAVWLLWRLRGGRGDAWAPLVALGVFGLFNAAFRSTPHAFVALLCAGMLAAGTGPAAYRGRLGAMAPGLAAAALCAAHVWTVLIPSFHLRAAEDAHVAGQDPIALYERVIAHPWPSPAAHEGIAMALMARGRHVEAAPHLRAAWLGIDTGRIYQLLAENVHALGDARAEYDWRRLCLKRWPWDDASWRRLHELSPPERQAGVAAEAAAWGVDVLE